MNYIVDEELIQEAKRLLDLYDMFQKWGGGSAAGRRLDKNIAETCAVYLKRLTDAAVAENEEGSGSGSGSGSGDGSGSGSGGGDVEQ